MLKQLIAASALVLSAQAMAEPAQPLVDIIANSGSAVAIIGAPVANSPVQLPAETRSESATMATLGLGLLSVVALRGRRKRYAS